MIQFDDIIIDNEIAGYSTGKEPTAEASRGSYGVSVVHVGLYTGQAIRLKSIKIL